MILVFLYKPFIRQLTVQPLIQFSNRSSRNGNIFFKPLIGRERNFLPTSLLSQTYLSEGLEIYLVLFVKYSIGFARLLFPFADLSFAVAIWFSRWRFDFRDGDLDVFFLIKAGMSIMFIFSFSFDWDNKDHVGSITISFHLSLFFISIPKAINWLPSSSLQLSLRISLYFM